MTMARIDAADLAKNITLKVEFRGFRRMAWRFRVAAALVALAAWVAGCKADVSSSFDA